jgi:hypothetical protein
MVFTERVKIGSLQIQVSFGGFLKSLSSGRYLIYNRLEVRSIEIISKTPHFIKRILLPAERTLRSYLSR